MLEPWQLTLYWVYCSSLTLQLPIRCATSDVEMASTVAVSGHTLSRAARCTLSISLTTLGEWFNRCWVMRERTL